MKKVAFLCVYVVSLRDEGKFEGFFCLLMSTTHRTSGRVHQGLSTRRHLGHLGLSKKESAGLKSKDSKVLALNVVETSERVTHY